MYGSGFIAACEDGQTAAAVAARFAISASFIEKLKRQRQERGTLGAETARRGPPARLAAYDEALRALLEAKPETPLAELRQALDLKVQLSTLGYRLDHLGLTFKENTPGHRQDREDIALKAWQAEQPTLDGSSQADLY